MSIELSSIVLKKKPKDCFVGSGLRVSMWGSSSTAANVYKTEMPNKLFEARDGYWYGAQIANGGTLFLKNVYGYKGASTATIVGNISSTYASDPDFDIAVLQLGANDIPNAAPDQTLENHIWNATRFMLARGKKVIHVTPHKTTAGIDANYIAYLAIINKVKTCFHRDVFVADHYTALKSVQNPENYLLADGVHTNTEGAMLVGRVAWKHIYDSFCGNVDMYPWLSGIADPIPNNPIPASGYTLVGTGAAFGAQILDSNYRSVVPFSATPSSEDVYVRKIESGIVSGNTYRAVCELEAITDIPTASLRVHNVDASKDFSFGSYATFGEPSGIGIISAGSKVLLITATIVADSTLASYCRLQLGFNKSSIQFAVNIKSLHLVQVG